ncbi:MAG: glycosyltransferase family 39 protein [Desulfobacterales bacterium]|nr:glycosyltransferase family 39 protein [Desulfobacterales bacterium]
MNAAWAWVIGFAFLRLAYSGTFPLVPDETNYWQWSRHMAWGYHDQAPLLAWAIRLGTAIFGQTEIGVRLPSVVSVAVASAYLVAMAGRWVSARAALQTAVLTQSILAYNVGGLLATPDGLQAAAWAAAAYHVARAYEDDRWSQWLLGGCWFGFGILSKYTMVVFLPGAYLYGLCSSRHRPRLAGIRPYVGVALGTAMFSPVIFWNAANNWNSVRHVAYIGGANEAFALHWKYFGDFLAAQAGLLSPLVFILILTAWVLQVKKTHRGQPWIYSYLWFTSIPMFAGFALLSLHARVYGNWPAAGYLTASVMLAAFFGRSDDGTGGGLSPRPGTRLWPWAVVSSYIITALVLIQAAWPVLPIPVRLDRTTTEIQGWPELGVEAGKMRDQMPDPGNTFLAGLRYQTASELAFYVPGQPATASINRWKRPNVYDYWWTDSDLMGKDAVVVTYAADSHVTRLFQVFDRVDPPVALKIFRNPLFYRSRAGEPPANIFYLYRAYGFKGGLRWIPPDPTDIRAG